MRNLQVQSTLSFITETCCECGIPFAILSDFQANLRKKGQQFFCPNGHPQWYGKSEAEKLREELIKNREEKARLQGFLNSTHRQIDEMHKEIADKKRMLNRVWNGVCPCCNRTFKNLARHMDTQHKDDKKGGKK